MNSRPAPSQRQLKKVDKKSAAFYHEQAKKFDQAMQEQQHKFHHSNSTSYHIVSCVYLKQWYEFCFSNQEKRLLPIPMNEDIADPNTHKLKQGLVQKQHFQVVSDQVYKIVRMEDDRQIPLPRTAYFEGKEKKVPIYLNEIRYLKIHYSDLRAIDFNQRQVSSLVMNEMQFSLQSTIEDLISAIKQRESFSPYRNVRLWKAPQGTTIIQIFKHIKEKCKPMNSPYTIPGIGKLIQNSSDTGKQLKISSLQLKNDQFIIVEIAEQKNPRWFFRSSNQQRCQNCYKYHVLKFICGCKKVGYCSQQCQQKDRYYHERRCTFAEEQELNRKIQMKMTSSSMRGLVGLSNIGNTCFMNSCLQCLSHTLPLTQYFIKSYYEQEINKENVLGTKGKLAKTYAKFIKSMWCDHQKTFSPSSLKNVVATLNPMFSGYAQHDSQQFFSFLVDGLHEDLSRVLKKPYVQSVESNGRPDSQVSKQSWIAHTMRNQSIITDLMTGQYKSKVVCPDCKKQSITFDPFITISLPIPQQTGGSFNFFLVFQNNEHQMKKYTLNYQNPDPQEWFYSAIKMLKKEASNFVFYVLTIYENTYDFLACPKAEIINKIQQGKNAFLLELAPDERNLKEPVILIAQFCKHIYSHEFQNLWVKRPFFFQSKQCYGKNVYIKAARYLYQIYLKKKGSSFFSSTLSEQDYIQRIMKKQRPFTLVLKYKKTLDRYFNRLETKFQKQIQIQDNTFIPDILKKLNHNDYELDIRVSKDYIRDFDFKKLKDCSDHTQKSYKKENKQKLKVQLEECFKYFEQKEILDVGNQWYCGNCKEHKLATKQMFIYKAPEILILHLKRFKNKGVWRKQKNQTNVKFPHQLDLSNFVINKDPMCTYRQLLKKQKHYHDPAYKVKQSKQSKPLYELYAISNHYGGLGGGHYTAYAKNNNKWFEFDDNYVKQVSQDSLKGSGAYILFYRRINGLQIQ